MPRRARWCGVRKGLDVARRPTPPVQEIFCAEREAPPRIKALARAAFERKIRNRSRNFASCSAVRPPGRQHEKRGVTSKPLRAPVMGACPCAVIRAQGQH